MRNKKKKMPNHQGSVLIIAIMTMGLMLFMGIYFLNFSLTESKISKGQTAGIKTYYLAEAGIAETIWKLKNDPALKNSFETDPGWTYAFTRNNPFGTGSGSYTVTVENFEIAHGEIRATGSYPLGAGKTAQRVVRTKVYKPMGNSSAFNEIAAYADQNIDLTFGQADFLNGHLHSNNNITLSFLVVNVAKSIRAVNQYIKSLAIVQALEGIQARMPIQYQPAPEPISMPGIDFDSHSPDSYKNLANTIYTQSQIKNYLDSHSSLTLNDDITFIDGNVEFQKGRDLTVNGLLVVNGNFVAGKTGCFLIPCYDSIIVNEKPGKQSGIIVKGKIEFGNSADQININGLLYSGGKTVFENPFSQPQINGGIVAQQLEVTMLPFLSSFRVTYNGEILEKFFPSQPELSPVISIEHWEEEY